MSLVQTRSGASTVNCRPRRFGATGRLWFESVVALYFFLALALMPCSAVSFLTRSLPTRIPLASSSFQIRGQPYSPFGLGMDRLDMHQQRIVAQALSPLRARAPAPMRVIAARTHPQ